MNVICDWPHVCCVLVPFRYLLYEAEEKKKSSDKGEASSADGGNDRRSSKRPRLASSQRMGALRDVRTHRDIRLINNDSSLDSRV